ncbi:hypothetical protein [Gordonia sp. SND2]|uniref:hypothetical protein n=1 Tax=Gordonia sp. SND2 TaxID=3388659 RepID=UPI00398B4078
MTTTEDLYQQANETYVEYTRRAALASLERAGLRAVVDLALAARPEMTDVEVLREARQIGYDLIGPMIWLDEIARLADRLEVDYRAEQEKAEREKLIEQAAPLLYDGYITEPQAWPDDYHPGGVEVARSRAASLVDAGWRPAPESDGGEQA